MGEIKKGFTTPFCELLNDACVIYIMSMQKNEATLIKYNMKENETIEQWERTFTMQNTSYSVSFSYRPCANALHNNRTICNNEDIDASKTCDNVVIVDNYSKCSSFYQRDKERINILRENTPIEKYIKELNERNIKNRNYNRLTDIKNELKKTHGTFVKTKEGKTKTRKYIQEQEIIFQIGNMDRQLNNEEITNNIYFNCLEQWAKQNENVVITQAIIHNDEKTPHLHIAFYTCEEKRNKKNNLQLDWSFDSYTKRNCGSFEKYRDNCIDMIERAAEMENIKARFEALGNRHKEINQYKEFMKQLTIERNIEPWEQRFYRNIY